MESYSGSDAAFYNHQPDAAFLDTNQIGGEEHLGAQSQHFYQAQQHSCANYFIQAKIG